MFYKEKLLTLLSVDLLLYSDIKDSPPFTPNLEIEDGCISQANINVEVLLWYSKLCFSEIVRYRQRSEEGIK